MLSRSLFAASLALLAPFAMAQPDELATRSLAATCAQCHGTDGRAVPGSLVPGLAGMAAAELVEKMKAFKSGTRPGSVMPQLAKGYSDARIERLAAYFATRPKAVP